MAYVMNLGRKKLVAMISFYFSTKTCQAQKGMTWTKWVNSEYNTVGVSIRGSYIYFGSYMFYYTDRTIVSPNDQILSDYTYTLSGK